MATEKNLLLALDVLTEGDSPMVPETLRPQAAVIQKESRPWTLGKGIQGLGIGDKITDGERLATLALKVYVDKKLPKKDLDNMVPAKIKVKGIPEEIPTDVEAIGKVRFEANTTRVRPAIPGYSVGHPDITAGTLGCLVRKTGDNQTVYILSNSHVLANEGLGSQGDKVIQPGDADGGTKPADNLGELTQWIPFQFSTTGYPNQVDAAIAKVKAADVTSAIRLIGVPAGVSTTVRRGMRIQKTGRTTDYTVGVIRDVNYRLQLNYKKPGGGTGRVGFRDQVLCTRYTEGGDSGSAVLTMQKKVVGLHFAGSESSSIFNRIGNVLSALGIVIITQTI